MGATLGMVPVPQQGLCDARRLQQSISHAAKLAGARRREVAQNSRPIELGPFAHVGEGALHVIELGTDHLGGVQGRRRWSVALSLNGVGQFGPRLKHEADKALAARDAGGGGNRCGSGHNWAYARRRTRVGPFQPTIRATRMSRDTGLRERARDSAIDHPSDERGGKRLTRAPEAS